MANGIILKKSEILLIKKALFLMLEIDIEEKNLSREEFEAIHELLEDL